MCSPLVKKHCCKLFLLGLCSHLLSTSSFPTGLFKSCMPNTIDTFILSFLSVTFQLKITLFKLATRQSCFASYLYVCFCDYLMAWKRISAKIWKIREAIILPPAAILILEVTSYTLHWNVSCKLEWTNLMCVVVFFFFDFFSICCVCRQAGQ